MDVQPDCVQCLMKRILFQAKLLNNGCEFDAVGAALRVYADEYGPGVNSADVATKVHRAAYDVMKADPYLELKIRADKVAGEYIDYAEEYVEKSDDRLSAAIRVAVIGNIMDFGAGLAIDDPDEFRSRFKGLLDQGLGSDDTEKFRDALKRSKSILYFFDNCGESQLDKILIKEIQNMGVRVVGVVRGEAILNDVTMEDAERIGLDKILDRIVTTGQFAIGVNLKNIGDDLREELSKADLVVAKGMANYESLSDQDTGTNKVFILRTKCVPVARSLSVPADINVVRFA